MSTPSAEPEVQPAAPDAGRGSWKLRDVVIGLAILLGWYGSGFVRPEWIAAVPFWVLIAVGTVLPMAFMVAYPALVARRRGFALFHWPGLKKLFFEWLFSIPVVFGLLVLLIAAGLAIRWISPGTALTPETWMRGTFSTSRGWFIAVLVLSFTIGPICEEVFFRGFLQGYLQTRMPVAVAAVLQSALFALVHHYGAATSVFVFCVGLVLTAVYAWRKTLLAPIFVHAGNNLIAASMLLLLMLVHANGPILGIAGRNDDNAGCRVETVAAGSGADAAHVQAGDIITAIDDQPVNTFVQLASTVRRHKLGDKVRLKILRDGKPIELKVVLGKQP